MNNSLLGDIDTSLKCVERGDIEGAYQIIARMGSKINLIAKPEVKSAANIIAVRLNIELKAKASKPQFKESLKGKIKVELGKIRQLF